MFLQYIQEKLCTSFICALFALAICWPVYILVIWNEKTHLLIMVPVITTRCMIMFGKIRNRMKPLTSQFGWKIQMDGAKITLYTDYQKNMRCDQLFLNIFGNFPFPGTLWWTSGETTEFCPWWVRLDWGTCSPPCWISYRDVRSHSMNSLRFEFKLLIYLSVDKISI